MIWQPECYWHGKPSLGMVFLVEKNLSFPTLFLWHDLITVRVEMSVKIWPCRTSSRMVMRLSNAMLLFSEVSSTSSVQKIVSGGSSRSNTGRALFLASRRIPWLQKKSKPSCEQLRCTASRRILIILGRDWIFSVFFVSPKGIMSTDWWRMWIKITYRNLTVSNKYILYI